MRSDPFLVLFEPNGAVPIPFQASLAVSEKMKSVFLGACGYYFGRFGIPEDFSGHSKDGKQSRNSKRHPYFFCLPHDDFTTVQYIAFLHRKEYSEENTAIFRLMDRLVDRNNGLVWQLSVVRYGNMSAIAENLPASLVKFVAPSPVWHSVTPYLKTRHLRIKRSEKHDSELYRKALHREITRNVAFELNNHGFPVAERITMNPEHRLFPSETANYCSDFLRTRVTRAGMDYGHSITIEFSESVSGPLLVGGNSHFGMGLFASF